MKQKLEEIKKLFETEIKQIKNSEQLENLKLKFMGKKGLITQVMPMLKDVANEQKREMGMLVNSVKTAIENGINNMQEKLAELKLQAELNNAKLIDITLPVNTGIGSLHPRTVLQQEIEQVFISMGFTVDKGNEIETEFNNFDAVNVPSTHPARDMQDTFWLNNGQVLKTHTSAGQNRILSKYKGTCRVIFPGRCFRNEALDAGHENTFFQMEGVIVDKEVSVANLIYFMKEMLSKVFKKEVEVRLRPGYFPFTEPSFEMDVKCPFCGGVGCKTCGNSGWIELCPCGMIHPNVLKMAGIDPNVYSGCAFGLGFDRLVMIKSNLNDIRVLNSGNLKVLKPFKVNI